MPVAWVIILISYALSFTVLGNLLKCSIGKINLLVVDYGDPLLIPANYNS